ncbi:hypothetical protein CWATWH0003_2991 [Crocosphaera watsonii WH 0003]|uniref:Uncharacterized protein n=2 Tax=Crocosphaera watsonii TaxID=263511 RepID=G5J688_CROWT|nr:hypothetical protein CWATWH0003_2991 [Crocosphaera watsonii WH 0003]CCQ56540.1 hypothetical protein CWATWH0005_1029 [Crocosphaera watsonii WH 0005]
MILDEAIGAINDMATTVYSIAIAIEIRCLYSHSFRVFIMSFGVI